MALTSTPIPKKVKTEIKIIESMTTWAMRREYQDVINEYLKDGWEILSSASAATVYFDKEIIIERYTYTATLVKTFWE